MVTAPTKPPAARQTPSSNPLFYRRPVPISPETFKGKSFAHSARCEFARRTNIVPLNVAEFASAQRYYPIVFGREEEQFPMAIVGVRDDENLFVGTDGRWRAGAYVPAYVRRYPFVLMRRPGEKNYLLCADMDSEFLVDDEVSPLFKNGKPTEVVKKAASICQAFETEADKTKEFCAALAEQNLLQAKSAVLAHESGRKIRLGPFRMVDERKFAELPGKIVTDWHGRGWLRLVHAHLFSLANWASLAARLSLH